MALQDLTPQLRTRLSRVERAVGLFVLLATLLMAAGLSYYVWHTAKKRGWFDEKVQYRTGLFNAAGIKEGDPVKLMGMTVGTVTRVTPNDPNDWYGMTVDFEVRNSRNSFYGYVWTDSRVRITAADFLGNRNLEITKGREGVATVLQDAAAQKPVGVLILSEVDKLKKEITAEVAAVARQKVARDNPTFNEHALEMEAAAEAQRMLPYLLREKVAANGARFYTNWHNAAPYWIEPVESPALTERLETVVNTLEAALPNILGLTNQLTGALDEANAAASRANQLMVDARPIVTNIAFITENLRDPNGSLGNWVLPTNLTAEVALTMATARTTMTNAQAALLTADQTLATANVALGHTDTNLMTLVSNLNLSLENLANLTSNLNWQVQQNTNILSNISSAIVHSDELMRGLQKHWLLRSAFKTNKVEKVTKPKKK